MTVWFTADLHLGHGLVSHLRGFQSPEEHDDFIVLQWGMKVRQEDTVWVLGDLAMGTFVESLERVARLPGTVNLIPGNHDRVHSTWKQSQTSRFAQMYHEANVNVYPEIFQYEHGLLLSHFPYDVDERHGERFAQCQPKDLGATLLHGHVHDGWLVRGRQLNVGVDVHGFAPISLDEIKERGFVS